MVTASDYQPDIGLGVWQTHSVGDLRTLAERAEAVGYRELWYANEKFYRDSYIGLTVLALSTTRLRLGPFVAEPYTKHPALLATAIATLDELSGGRMVLLLGAGGSGFREMAIARHRPVRALEETLHIVRGMLSGQTVTHLGEVFSVREARLEVPTRSDLPIYIASRGDRMLQMAGHLADGVMVATYASPKGVQHALRQVELGAAGRGRTLNDVDIIVRVDTAIADDREMARSAVRPMIVGILMASYPDQSFLRPLGVVVPDRLMRLVATKDRSLIPEGAALVTDELVDSYAWAGTVDDVVSRVVPIARLGVRHFAILPHPATAAANLSTACVFATEVMPRVVRELRT